MEPGKLCEKYLKSSYKARENWYKGMKGSILAFSSNKSADLVPEKLRKSGNLA